jgi:hypothetical protein
MSSPAALEAIASMTAGISFLAATAWIVHSWLTNRRIRRQSELASRLHDKLLDKFDSTAELTEFLSSPSGDKILTQLPQERPQTHARLLATLQIGVVLAPVSVGVLWMQDMIPDAAEGFRFLGIMGLCLAIGFLASAGVAYWASRRLGLLDPGSARES